MLKTWDIWGRREHTHDLSSAMGRICGAIVEMIKIGSHKKKIIKNNAHENIFM